MIERSIDIKKKILNLELGVFFSEIDNYFNRNKFNILQFDQIKEEKPKCPNKEIPKVNDNIFIKKESDFEYLRGKIQRQTKRRFTYENCGYL